MHHAAVGVGAEAGELFQSGARCHGLEVAKEAVPCQERLMGPLRGDESRAATRGWSSLTALNAPALPFLFLDEPLPPKAFLSAAAMAKNSAKFQQIFVGI